MPGLHLVQVFEPERILAEGLMTSALAEITCCDDESRILWETDRLVLARLAYPSYPVMAWEDDRTRIFLEGRVYDTGPERLFPSLANLAPLIFDPEGRSEKVADWLIQRDGEFAVWLFDKNSPRTAVLSDLFGNLPVYYRQSADMIVVSREAKFVNRVGPKAEFDRLGLAQYLSLGHCLGQRSPWRDVFILNPACLLTINPVNQSLSVKKLFEYNFSTKKYRGVTLAENASRLSELLGEGCAARAGRGGVDLLSLSGGMDSRTAGAGLAASKSPFDCVTFTKAGYNKGPEVETAKRTAEILGRPWHLYQAQATNGQAALELLKLRSGLNPLWLSFLLEFFRWIIRTFGPDPTYFTGDGGNFTVPDKRPARPIFNLDGLVRYAFDANFRLGFGLKFEDAAQLTGIDPRDLKQSLAGLMEQYPESTWAEKFIHYLIYEFQVKLYNEGQDRNRCFFWSTNPFFATGFFDYVMNCPDEQKAYYRLYHRLLLNLSPELGRLKYINYGHDLGTSRFYLAYFLSQKKVGYPRLVKRIKHLLKGEDSFSPQSEVVQIISNRIVHCKAVSDYLDPDVIKRLIGPKAKYSRAHIMQLFMVSSLIELNAKGACSLGDYPAAILI